MVVQVVLVDLEPVVSTVRWSRGLSVSVSVSISVFCDLNTFARVMFCCVVLCCVVFRHIAGGNAAGEGGAEGAELSHDDVMAILRTAPRPLRIRIGPSAAAADLPWVDLCFTGQGALGIVFGAGAGDAGGGGGVGSFVRGFSKVPGQAESDPKIRDLVSSPSSSSSSSSSSSAPSSVLALVAANGESLLGLTLREAVAAVRRQSQNSQRATSVQKAAAAARQAAAVATAEAVVAAGSSDGDGDGDGDERAKAKKSKAAQEAPEAAERAEAEAAAVAAEPGGNGKLELTFRRMARHTTDSRSLAALTGNR